MIFLSFFLPSACSHDNSFTPIVTCAVMCYLPRVRYFFFLFRFLSFPRCTRGRKLKVRLFVYLFVVCVGLMGCLFNSVLQPISIINPRALPINRRAVYRYLPFVVHPHIVWPPHILLYRLLFLPRFLLLKHFVGY